MDTKISTFLNSGLLEKYVIGDTSFTENFEVEQMISMYPEVKNHYQQLQSSLELISQVKGVKAPAKTLKAINQEISKNNPSVIKLQTSSKGSWYSTAVSVAAVVCAMVAIFFYQKSMVLQQENQLVVDEIYDLRGDIKNNNDKLDNIMRQFIKLNNPETEKYVIRGNERAKNLKTVAYINAAEKTSMIDVVSLPQLPDEECYHIWAELQDKMVNLGILDNTKRRLKHIPYMEDALSLSITIEPKGTPNSRFSDNEVAEVALDHNK